MKRLVLILSLFVFGYFLPTSAQAQSNFKSGETVSVPENEVIDSDFFAAGEKVVIQGTINGDLYAAGGDISISGTVMGDILAATGNLTIEGNVVGNVRTLAGNIAISGNVAKNITAATGNLTIGQTATVGGSLTAGSGNISLLGPIGKGVTVGAGSLTLANSVGGDVVAGVQRLTLNPSANVAGKLLYWSENVADINSGAVVAGEIEQRIPEKHETSKASAKQYSPVGTWAGWNFFSFLTTLILGLVLIRLMPILFNRFAATFTARPLPSLGLGLLLIAATPFILFLFLISLIGIPLIFVWLFVLGVALWLAKVIAAIVVGDWLKKQLKLRWNHYLTFGVGLFVYSLITAIPFLGWLISFLVGLVGLGAFTLLKRDYYLELRHKKLI